jgi:integrase
MKAQYKFIFARKGADENGIGLIQLQVYFTRQQRILVSTKKRIHESQWDPRNHQVKVTNKESGAVYEMLSKLVRDLEQYEMELIRSGQSLTPAKVKTHFETEKADTFNNFIRMELETDRSLKYGTTKTHWVTLRKLDEFSANIQFDDIGYDFVTRFDNYLHSLDLSVNTIAGHHKHLRRYIQVAIRKGLLKESQHPYRGKFKVKKEAVERTYLTDDEILAIEKIDYQQAQKMQRIQDMFLFCIYSGLSHCDMQALSMDHIRSTPEGYEIMQRRQKSSEFAYIPLHMLFGGKGEAILKKYMDPENHFIFPRISDQKGNEYLKVIAAKAEIRKKISWHIARHTFGTQLAARCNDPFMIMNLMGHQEIKTSMIYIHSSHEILKAKLKREKW